MDLYDDSPEAAGMTYHNELDSLGVPVDGLPEPVPRGQLQWEMVTGAQGSVIVAHSVETGIPGFSTTSYYSDDATPAVIRCTGDAFEYATSGLWIDGGIPNTDPRLGPFYDLRAIRVVYYDAPGLTAVDAELRFDQPTTPIGLATAPLPEAACSDGLDNDGDGGIDCDGGAASNDGIPIDDSDPQCAGEPWLNREKPSSYRCGLGAELALLLPLLVWIRRRRS